jgi:hypothetical protein
LKVETTDQETGNTEMRTKPSFDEVMIVNPFDPSTQQGVQHMRFHQVPGAMGYFAQAPQPQNYGYYGQPVAAYGQAAPAYGAYAEPADPYGYYAEAPEPYAGYAEPADPYGYYAEAADPYGYVAEPADPYGYYGEPADPYGDYAEAADPYGYYGEPADPYGSYGEPAEPYGSYAEMDPTYAGYLGYGAPGGFAEMPEMPGYAKPDPAMGQSAMSYYGDPYFAGYVRDQPPQYNPGCPMPVNVAGYEGAGDLSGYVTPSSVSPNCTQFTPQQVQESSSPEIFSALW